MKNIICLLLIISSMPACADATINEQVNIRSDGIEKQLAVLSTNEQTVIFHDLIPNGNATRANCSGIFNDLSSSISSEHVQSWSYLYEKEGYQYFMGAISNTTGGYLFTVQRNIKSNSSCVIWSQKMNIKGGQGNNHDQVWGFWDHPSQIAVIGEYTSNIFVAITVNCFLGVCAEEDEGGVIFVNIDDPAKPFKYPTMFLSDEWVEPDVLDITKINDKWILGIGNAKGSLDPDSSRNKMWVYHTPELNYDDPGASWRSPADKVMANGLLHVNIQYCGYITERSFETYENEVFWICLGGHKHKKESKSNYIWGSKVDSDGLPINTVETYIDRLGNEPNGEIPFNSGEYKSEYCYFRGGASISISSEKGILSINCASWNFEEDYMGFVQIINEEKVLSN